MTSPKAQKAAKLQYTLVPPHALESVAKVLQFGAGKHGANEWRNYPLQGYIDAIERHLSEIKKGRWLDIETGLPHVSHIACSAMFLCEKQQFRPKEWEEVRLKFIWGEPQEEEYEKI